MPAKPVPLSEQSSISGRNGSPGEENPCRFQALLYFFILPVRASSQSWMAKNKVYKGTGLFSLRRKLRMQCVALRCGTGCTGVEELRQIEQEEMIPSRDGCRIIISFLSQATITSVDVSKFLDHYEMSKHLTGPYDMEGACIVIRAGSEGTNSEVELRECSVF
ncbi:peptide chain release factor PrfB3, chloroplastic [Cinnamomum micranthum f. kanehirae]|uniref:Peptide chain release factor PrfB3, chloroplastic n=1 Tax=Cinnamomum micranthum f. kanehirae TaxID=337451 RepID=A0A443N858_9MAGN|nr:peptide chain release factor PrfB3, chloroplastic [Cinnamomum micranthum f. kanehirae]